jgi:DNA-binding transcriptional MerR regulator
MSADLERLQQVLLYRALGFELRRIVELMAVPTFDRREALMEQRDLLAGRVEQLGGMLDLIDRTIAGIEGDKRMTNEEMFEVFADFDWREHEDEARSRWGDTDAYKESARRARSYTKDDWQRVKAELHEINLRIAGLMEAGTPASDTRTLDAVEHHRLHIERWFYPCSREMHAALGRMYVDDPRFAATYEEIRTGMARYMRDATVANAAREP